MALQKCPKCELNYISEGEARCEVCKRDLNRAQVRGKHVDNVSTEAEILVCTECGEAPAVRGELCNACFKEKKRQAKLENVVETDDEFGDALEDEDEE